MIRIDGLWVLRAERLILESTRSGFTQAETESAIDSAIRLRLVGEQRLKAGISETERQTELTLRGVRWIRFTYTDVRDRPAWVVARLAEALRMAA